jgi:hypothetical protein
MPAHPVTVPAAQPCAFLALVIQMALSGTVSDATLPGTGTYTVDVYPTGSSPGLNVGNVKLALTTTG